MGWERPNKQMANNKDSLTPGQIGTLRQIHVLAVELNIADSLMLIGATARLLQLDWPLGHTGRTTEDVDFVVQVDDWSQHHELMALALQRGFEPKPEEHRLVHTATSTCVDLVPFGGLENPEGTIKWPRSEFQMSVWGMLEAQQTAVDMQVADDISIRVVTLPCLVALKMFAWLDRRYQDKGQGDLADADFILSHCPELPAYEEQAWEAFGEATEVAAKLGRTGLSHGDHVGAVLVGRELRDVLRPETKARLHPIIEPLTEDPYHPAIEQLIRAGAYETDLREIVSLRYAILTRYLAP